MSEEQTKPAEAPVEAKAETPPAEEAKVEAKAETPPPAEAKAKTGEKEKEASTPGKPTKKVLIVEDTIELAEVLQATLERLGISALHETHAAKAIELYKVYQPDLILLDIGLPDMSGWKFLDSVKEHKREDLPKFIIITAYGDPANRLMGKLQDVASYLIKPFSPDEVESVVKKVLES